jgi:prepilin-type N-terminal cleavage/methylation domain-containing protein
MHHSKNGQQGFTIIELVISLGVLCLLGAMAWPAYKNFKGRTYYSDILTAVAPFKTGVIACFQDTHQLSKCNGGTNHIPANMLTKKDSIANLKVYSGIIMVTPAPGAGVTATDTYVLTPTVANNALTWQTSGGAVQDNFAE